MAKGRFTGCLRRCFPARRVLLGARALIVLGVGVLLVSARLSLDTEHGHTRRVEKLPSLSPATAQGLVQVRARGLSFRAHVAGLDGDGPALLLLHGFPETSIMWRPLIEAAAQAGFRVVAFDQRGYSPLARPTGVEDYRLSELVADVFAVASAVGFERFHLVGHDWGAIVGWVAAGQDRERVRSYASLSIPHPSAIRMANEGQGAPAYVRFFRMPGVPETLFTAGGLAPMRNAMYESMPTDQVDEPLADSGTAERGGWSSDGPPFGARVVITSSAARASS